MGRRAPGPVRPGLGCRVGVPRHTGPRPRAACRSCRRPGVSRLPLPWSARDL